MDYKHIKIPEGGELLSVAGDKLVVPDNAVLGFVEGDGIGPDITRACLRICVPASLCLCLDEGQNCSDPFRAPGGAWRASPAP